MGNRTSEVLKFTKISEWNHADTKDNIADLGTRTNAEDSDIDENSDWQRGNWMRLEKKYWKLTKDISGATIAPEELVNKGIVAFANSVDNIIKIYDLHRFRGRSYTFMLNVTGRVLNAFHAKKLKGLSLPLTADTIIEAENICIKASMFYTKQDLDAGKLKSLRARTDEDGVICVNSRANEELKLHYGRDRFPILAYKDPMSFIWMQHVHDEDHSGVTKTVAKSRRKFWIVRARKLAYNIRRNCYECRRIDKELAEQQMAPLPDSRLKMAPTFHTTSLDLFGPIEIRDTIKQRTRKKVWGAIFSCTVTRAVYIHRPNRGLRNRCNSPNIETVRVNQRMPWRNPIRSRIPTRCRSRGHRAVGREVGLDARSLLGINKQNKMDISTRRGSAPKWTQRIVSETNEEIN